MVVYCDNSSTIDIFKNLVQHSKTKHIEIKYHFIRDLVEGKIVALEYIPIKRQNANIFTKPLDRRNTSGGCFYVGANLVTWMSKKQNFVSLSTAEAEYIATRSCCSQLLWIKKLLGDYGISQDPMVIYCDNSNAIDISKNPIQHSMTKHIEIRYHFIRDLVERKIVTFEYIPTERQNADIFTKPLDRSNFETFRQVIGVILCP